MMNKLNNKGFTLVELLATIVILGIISTVTIIAVTGYYEKSQDKTEEVFRGQIEKYVSDYISLYGSKLKYDKEEGIYQKCHTDLYGEKVCEDINLYYNQEYQIEDVIFHVVSGELKNPVTEKECKNDNTNLTFYRDNDFVYCFKLEPYEDTDSCISKEIDTCSGIFIEKNGE